MVAKVIKQSNADVAEAIISEGLGYAVQYYLSANSIEDKHLAELWQRAQDILDEIEAYLEDEIADANEELLDDDEEDYEDK